MRVHFIAIGGAAMHNLAIALHLKGFNVSGSDDVIYEPSRTRLSNYSLLPKQMGWHEENITKDLDAVILGMHAKADNPELLKAQALNIPVYSYPEYVYEQSKNKKRIVIGGSHGKTTITSMILHVLKYYNIDFDYLVGAQIEGFATMVKLSDAPIIVVEGDEYLASPIDRRPKFHLYKAHVGVISGVAWDHINVFPTFESYKEQFSKFIDTIEPKGNLIYSQDDDVLVDIVDKHENVASLKFHPYTVDKSVVKDGKTYLEIGDDKVELAVFGKHNLMNLSAARLVVEQVGVSSKDFYKAIQSFKGASKRLEKIAENEHSVVFKDFAHSPSKLKATVAAVKEQYPNRSLLVCVELHTFSSLDKNFLAEYEYSLYDADDSIVYIDESTARQKEKELFTKEEISEAFKLKEFRYVNNPEMIEKSVIDCELVDCNVLFMSSGNFGGIDLVTLSKKILLK